MTGIKSSSVVQVLEINCPPGTNSVWNWIELNQYWEGKKLEMVCLDDFNFLHLLPHFILRKQNKKDKHTWSYVEHTPWSTFLTSSNIRNPIQAVAATENTEVMSSGFLCELGGSFQKSKLSLFFVIYRQIRICVGSIYAWTWRLLGKYQMKTWAGYQYECRYTTFLWEKQTYFCISNLFFFSKETLSMHQC